LNAPTGKIRITTSKPPGAPHQRTRAMVLDSTG
jgi:hypothetical protein